MYKYPDLEGDEPPPSWVNTLAMAKDWGCHPETVEKAPAKWAVRWILNTSAQIKAQKTKNG